MRRLSEITRLLLVGGFLLAAVALGAQCIEGNCQGGEGVYLFPDGARYVGQFQAGKPSGEGMLFKTDGSRYVGQFQNGQPEGKGVEITPQGERFPGLFTAGRRTGYSDPQVEELIARGGPGGRTGCVSGNCRDGQGVYILPDGAIYVGDFAQGEIHGNGICYYPDGSRYQGGWAHRYPHGRGTKTWPDGRTQSGSWLRGLPTDEQGRPMLSQVGRVMPSGFVAQSGCLQGNCQNGRGFFAYPDGSRYQGDFRGGRPEGQGTFNYPNGDVYEGTFQGGMRHGAGTLVTDGGRHRLSGQWQQGEYIPPRPEKGCISGNCQNGFGTYVYPSGDRYIGEFSNGQPNGRGKLFFVKGARYEGEMQNGKLHGYGEYYQDSGPTYRGQWQDDGFVSGTVGESPQPAPAAELRAPLPKVWAIIIGVSAYSHMPVLRYPDDDAYRIYAFLKSPAGGGIPDEQIRILIDEAATKENIKLQMRDLFGKAGPNDLVFLYFSGHGLPGSFLPIDYDGFENQLYHQEFKDLLDASPARYKLCLADACHSGSLFNARDGQFPSMMSRYYEKLAQAKPGTALLMSSKMNETSLESSGLRQGVFSHFLIRGFGGEADKNADKLVTLQELYNFVQENVRAYTGGMQSPVIQGSYDPNMPVSVVR